MNSVEHSSSNCLPSLTNLPVNQDTTVEELDPFAVGASEEVNTTTASDDRNAFEKDVTEGIDTSVSESAGARVTSLLNTPYRSSERNMAVNKYKGRGLRSVKVYDSANNSENATDKSIESGPDCNINVTDTDASLTTTVLVSEGVSLDPTQGSYVVHVVEQVAIDHINQYISASQADERCGNTVVLQEQSDRHQFTGNNKSINTSSKEESRRSFHDVSTGRSGNAGHEDSDLEDIDTGQIAEALTNELKKYSIPQAVFARKILNRSQGTLSDVLRKPKPWNEMKGGRDIFRKMKEWLELPEVKRIPQLRAEAALELDSKAKKEETNRPPAKRARLHFTDSQKRALFAIFKETKKPSREMQIALAEELGLERGTVANFFMNARRRHPEI